MASLSSEASEGCSVLRAPDITILTSHYLPLASPLLRVWGKALKPTERFLEQEKC